MIVYDFSYISYRFLIFSNIFPIQTETYKKIGLDTILEDWVAI